MGTSCFHVPCSASGPSLKFLFATAIMVEAVAAASCGDNVKHSVKSYCFLLALLHAGACCCAPQVRFSVPKDAVQLDFVFSNVTTPVQSHLIITVGFVAFCCLLLHPTGALQCA
jgi:hypothetical protein